ncbi:MAG: YabP/YqfC family sporulation protein [Clostridia bacterium]|nr:YabP/YqfC family sporulation protein [Clostridia bacterium]
MQVTKQAEALLDLPQGVLTGELLMEVRGRRQVILEGACDLIEYDESCVRLRAEGREVRLSGHRLAIETLSVGGASVSGQLLSIEFL